MNIKKKNILNIFHKFKLCIVWNWFMVSLFNGISTFVVYLMPKPFSLKNRSGTI